MAALRDIARDFAAETRDGIGWTIVYRTGRSWNALTIWSDIWNGEWETDDLNDAIGILKADPDAVIVNGYYWSAATKEVLVQKLAAYENTGYEPDEIRAAIEQAAKNSETKTATIMAECIAGAMKDTLEKYGTAGSGKKGETP